MNVINNIQPDLFTKLTPQQISKETREEYVRYDGDYCPFCRSTNVHQDGKYSAVYEIDVFRKRVQCSMVCEDCCKSWYDIYSLCEVAERVGR